MSHRGLTREVALSVLGQSIYAMAQLLAAILISRWWGLAGMGMYTLALSVSAPVFIGSQMKLRTVAAGDAGGRFLASQLGRVRVVSSAVALSVSLFLGSVALRGTSGYGAAFATVGAVSFSKAVESQSDLAYGFMQRKGSFGRMSSSLSVRGLWSVLALVLGKQLLNLPLEITLGLVGFGWLVVYSILDSSYYPPIWRSPEGRMPWRPILVAVAPLGLAASLASLVPNLPRYAVATFSGTELLGVYGALSYLAFGGTMFVNAAGQAVLPRLGSSRATEDYAQLKKLAFQFFALAAIVGALAVLVAVVAGVEIVIAVFGESFVQSRSLIVLIVSAGAIGFLASAATFVLVSIQSFRVLLGITSITVAVAGAAAFVFVPLLGLHGAGISLLVANCVQIGLSMCFILRFVASSTVRSTGSCT